MSRPGYGNSRRNTPDQPPGNGWVRVTSPDGGSPWWQHVGVQGLYWYHEGLSAPLWVANNAEEVHVDWWVTVWPEPVQGWVSGTDA